MKRLRTTKNRSERLQGHSRNVVHRLLRCERNAGSLSVRAKFHRCRLFCAKSVAHEMNPYPSGRTKFGYLFKEIVVDIKEKGEPRGKRIHRKTTTKALLDIGNTVVNGKRKLLNCRRSGFPNMIARDTDRVESGGVL